MSDSGSDNKFVETQDIARLLSSPVDSGSDNLRDEKIGDRMNVLGLLVMSQSSFDAEVERRVAAALDDVAKKIVRLPLDYGSIRMGPPRVVLSDVITALASGQEKGKDDV